LQAAFSVGAERSGTPIAFPFAAFTSVPTKVGIYRKSARRNENAALAGGILWVPSVARHTA
jgi:hypothetical protein